MLLFDFLGKTHKLAEEKDIESIRIGGRNRLRESSFCFDGSVPTTKNWAQSTVNDVYDQAWTTEGLHYKTHQNNNALNSSYGIYFAIEDLGLVAGETIAISVDIKGSFGDRNNGLCVMHPTNDNPNFYARVFTGGPHPASYDTWTRIERIFTIPYDIKSTSDGKHNLWIFFGGGTDGRDADVWIKNVQIEKGSYATDYKPAVEDILSRIEALESATVGGGVKFYPHLRLGVL